MSDKESKFLADLQKDLGKDPTIDANRYKKLEKKFATEIAGFPKHDGLPSILEINQIKSFFDAAVVNKKLEQNEYDTIFAPMVKQMFDLAKEYELEKNNATNSIDRAELKEQANANKDIINIWKKNERSKVLDTATHSDILTLSDRDLHQVLVAANSVLAQGETLTVDAIKVFYPGAENQTTAITAVITAVSNDVTIKSLVAMMPHPTQNEVFALVRGKDAKYSSYQDKLSDFNRDTQRRDYQRQYTSSEALKQKDQYRHMQTVDMIGSMTGQQMYALLQDATTYLRGNDTQIKDKLAKLYTDTQGTAAKILFDTGNPSFDDIMKQPPAAAQLQTSIALLGYDKAYRYLIGGDGEVLRTKITTESVDISTATQEKEIQNSPEMQEATERCYQQFIKNAQSLIQNIQIDTTLSSEEQKTAIQDVLVLMNNKANMKDYFQQVMWSAMASVADSRYKKQFALGAGVGKTYLLEELKFLQKAGFLHSISGNMGMSLAPVPGGAGVGIGLAVPRAGSKSNTKGETFFYSLTPSIGASKMVGMSSLPDVIQYNIRLNTGMDFLLNPKANKKDLDVYKQYLVKSAVYGGGYGYVDLKGYGGGLYIRRDKEKGIDDKRAQFESYYASQLPSIMEKQSSTEIYNALKSSITETKKKVPKETDIRLIAGQLWEMKQAIETASGGDTEKQIGIIADIAKNASYIWETSYRNSQKTGFFKSLSVTGMSVGVGMSWYGLPPVIEAGLSLGWIKGNRIEADMTVVDDIHHRVETMDGATMLEQDRDQTHIDQLNADMKLPDGNKLMLGKHEYMDEIGANKSFATIAVPAALLKDQYDHIDILVNPTYVPYIKQEGNTIILPAALFNVQIMRGALINQQSRYFLTIGLGADTTAKYRTMVEHDIPSASKFTQREKVRTDWEYQHIQKQFNEYMGTIAVNGKKPAEMITDLATKLNKPNLDFVRNADGNYHFHKKDNKDYILLDAAVRGDQPSLLGETMNTKKYYLIPVENTVLHINTISSNEPSKQKITVTTDIPTGANTGNFVINIENSANINTITNTRFDLALPDVSPDVYAITINHDALMMARYGKVKGRYNAAASKTSKAFNAAMERNDLNTAKTFIPTLFPTLKDKNLNESDLRGLYGALCLVHRTNNKSFKESTAYETKKTELFDKIRLKRNSNNPSFKAFKNGLPGANDTFEETAPYKDRLDKLLTGTYTDQKRHIHDVNSIEYQLYWMFSPLARVEQARGIDTIKSFDGKKANKRGFDYGSLLYKEWNGNTNMMHHFADSFAYILQQDEAKKSQIATIKDSEQAKDCLSNPDTCDDIVMYPNAVTAVVGGNNADPAMKYVHHGMMVKGLEKDFTADTTPGATARKQRFLEDIQSTEYWNQIKNTLLCKQGNTQLYQIVDNTGSELTGNDLEETLKKMILESNYTVQVKVSNGSGGWKEGLQTLRSEPKWVDGYFVQCFNPSTTLSIQTYLTETTKQEAAISFKAPDCTPPRPFINTVAQGVRMTTNRRQVGLAAAYQFPEAKKETPIITTDPNAEPIAEGEKLDGNVFGNNPDVWQGNDYNTRWKELQNNNPGTFEVMRDYINANKGDLSFGVYRNQIIDQFKALVASGANPNAALRQVLGKTIIVSPTSPGGASITNKFVQSADPTIGGDIRTINNKNHATRTVDRLGHPSVGGKVNNSTPTSNPDSTPTSNPDSTPTSNPDSTPTSNPDSTPTSNPDSTPTSNPDSTPTSNPDSTPTSNPDSTPTSNPDSTPTSNPDSTPTSNPDSTPTSNPDSTPTSNPDSTPTSNPDSTPTSNPDSTPTSNPDSTPTSNPDSTPTSNPDSTPTSNPDSTPTSNPDSTPTSNPDSTPTLNNSQFDSNEYVNKAQQGNSLTSIFSGVDAWSGNLDTLKDKSLYRLGTFDTQAGEIKSDVQKTRLEQLYAILDKHPDTVIMFGKVNDRASITFEEDVNDQQGSQTIATVKIDVLDPNNALILKILGGIDFVDSVRNSVPSFTAFRDKKSYIPASGDSHRNKHENIQLYNSKRLSVNTYKTWFSSGSTYR